MLAIISVKGRSMQPTLQPDEQLLALVPFSNAFYQVGRIVTLQHFPLAVADSRYLQPEYQSWRQLMSDKIGDFFIKRIVATANETVHISMTDIHSSDIYFVEQHAKRISQSYVWHVPTDHVFVRGDSGIGIDSVLWGPIPISSLRHIVLCRYPSLRRIR